MTVKYTKEHEWLVTEGNIATVGITSFAQEQLGDVVFVDLPKIGKEVKQHGEAAVVESVKAASEVYSPIAGKIVAVNENLNQNPALVNQDPEGMGWFFKVEVASADELETLMDASSYKTYIAGV